MESSTAMDVIISMETSPPASHGKRAAAFASQPAGRGKREQPPASPPAMPWMEGGREGELLLLLPWREGGRAMEGMGEPWVDGESLWK